MKTIPEPLQRGKNMLFIGGPPRSGTTLMQRIMGAHSQVYAGPEFDFIPTDIHKLRTKMLASIRSGRIKSIVDECGLDQALGTFITSIFEKRLEHAGKSFFSEKTPGNALVFQEIEKMLPESRYIMMIRDPRDIVKSMAVVREKFLSNRKRPPRFVRSVAASVQEVNRYYDAGITAAEKSKKILLVYYEDLVRNPTHEVQKVCEHIGLPYEEGMLNIENSILGDPKSDDDEHWYSKSGLQQPIRLKGVISGSKTLRPSEVSLVERFTQAKPALDRYNIGRKRPSLREAFLWRASLARKACIFCPR